MTRDDPDVARGRPARAVQLISAAGEHPGGDLDARLRWHATAVASTGDQAESQIVDQETYAM